LLNRNVISKLENAHSSAMSTLLIIFFSKALNDKFFQRTFLPVCQIMLSVNVSA